MITAEGKDGGGRVRRAKGYERRRVAPAPAPDYDRPVHFLHIGKNAGSQVLLIARQINRQNGEVGIIKHRHHVFLRDIPRKAEYFFSIRNPVSRFVSGFYSRKRKGQPRFDREWTPFEAQAFADFEHANDLAEALFTEGKLGMQAFGAIKSIQHTAMNQVDWFSGFGNIFTVRPPVWVVRQERFDDDIAVLCSKLGYEGGIRIVADPVKSHRGDYSDTPELSERAVENLKQWYVQDLEFYRTCEDWLSQNGGLASNSASKD